MAFDQTLQGITDETLIIRTGLVDALWEDGYEGDVVLAFNLASGKVTPLTYEDLSQPFYAQFWSAIRMVLDDFDDNDFQIERQETQAVLYSDYDDVEDESLSHKLPRATVIRIFKAAVLSTSRL